MAKLNVTIPAVDVSVNGVAYRKVDRKAQAGDIVKALESSADIDEGAFYGPLTAASGNTVSFTDNVGYPRTRAAYGYEVYAAVAEPAVEYREVKRKANVGERIKIVNAVAAYDYVNGDEVTVIDVHGSGGVTFRDKVNAKNCAHLSEYVVLEPVAPAEADAKPKRLTVGDFAKVIDTPGDDRAALGNIVEVEHVRRAFDPSDGEMITAKDLAGYSFSMYSRRFAPATPEEVAAAQAEANRKIAVGPFAGGGFAQIVDADKSEALIAVGDGDFVKVSDDYGYAGRFALKATRTDGKYGFCNADALRQITEAEYNAAVAPEPEFSVGDKIQITRNQCNWPVGTVATITEVLTHPNHESGTVWAKALGETYLADGNCFEKLTAEEVAAIEKEAQEAARWAKIGRKVNEFKRGDIAEATRLLGKNERVIGEVEDTPRKQSGGEMSAGLRLPDGTFYAVDAEGMTLIVPVEQRFDKTDAEKAAA